MTRYIAGYNGYKFVDITKAVDLKQKDDGKVYLIDKDGNVVGNGVAIGTGGTLTIYDDTTGQTSSMVKTGDNFTLYDDETQTTLSKTDGFTYEDITE